MKRLVTLLIIVGACIGLYVAFGDRLDRSTNTYEKDSITVVSFGGAYQAAQREAYMKPFAEETGVNIVEGEYNGDYGVLRERAKSGTGSWDVVSVESAPALRGQKEGIFLRVPEKLLSESNLVAAAKREYAVGHLLFSTIMAFREDASFSGRPSNWKDFWDLEKFPGKRGLRNNPRGTLEIALLASGVSPDQLYPLDYDRAFEQLDEIRDETVFWTSGAQPLQLLANQQVTMTSVYNGRVWDAKTNEGLPFDWTLNQGLLEVEYWAVPANAPNPEVAFEFIRYSVEQNRQVSFANQIAYIPANPSARPLVDPAILIALPDTDDTQIDVDANWWSENEAVASARWQQWITE